MPTLDTPRKEEGITSDVIDKEIDKWEQMHTGCAIMKAHYDTEKQLDDDWYTWTCMSYHMKVLSNNLALQFYGIKNEKLYYIFKQHFLSKNFDEKEVTDDKEYAPETNEETIHEDDMADDNTDGNVIDKKAKNLTQDTGYFIVTSNNQNLEKLTDQINKFRGMTQEKRAKADTLSLQLYGMKNEDHYKKQLYKLSNNSNVDDNDFKDVIDYDPPTKKDDYDELDTNNSPTHINGVDHITESTYQDSLSVYNSLNKDEKLYVAPRGRFVDSPSLVYRYVYKVNNKAVGFIEIYKYNGKSKTTGFASIAVSPKFRGKGISKILLDNAIKNLKSLGYKKLVYNADTNNIPSNKTAEKMNFELKHAGNDYNSYEKILTEAGAMMKTNYDRSPIKYCETIREAVRTTNDPIEAAIFLNESFKDIKTDDVVLSSIKNVMIENFKNRVDDKSNYLGWGTPYFLPQEMEDLGVYDEDGYFSAKPLDIGFAPLNITKPQDWFYNYQARCIGLKPPMEFLRTKWNATIATIHNGLDNITPEDRDSSNQSLLEFGWNPSIPYNPENLHKASERTNRIIRENMGYDFINITKMVDQSSLESRKFDPGAIGGICVVFLSKADATPLNADIPKVYVTTDPTLSKIYPLNNGLFTDPISLESIRFAIKGDICIKLFYLKVPRAYEEKLSKAIAFYASKSNDVRFKYSFIQGICSRIKCACPDIANEKLFCVYLMNMILSLISRNYLDPYSIAVAPTIANMRNDPTVKDHIYVLFNGNSYDFNPNSVVNALYAFRNSKDTPLNESLSFLKPYLKLHTIKEVATLPVDFDKDGNLFIRRSRKLDFAAEFSACHKLLLSYSKAKGYEAMKYYIAKLWYMNILLEKKIHAPKKTPQLEAKLSSYYTTRAHILADFKKYMNEILINEPNFDFREYYKQTPFDRSTLKISNTFLSTIWGWFQKLLSGGLIKK
jgi:ribosomal protein S18 acetylase RimI-like enzyme